MTETSHRTQNYKIDHSTFGGTIYPTDYYTNYPPNGRSIASRIASDWGFDQWCKRNAKDRENSKNYEKSKQNNENQ